MDNKQFMRLLTTFCVLIFVCNLYAQTEKNFMLELGTPGCNELASAMLAEKRDYAYLTTISHSKKNAQSRCKLYKISGKGKIIWTKEFPQSLMTISSIIEEADGTLLMAGYQMYTDSTKGKMLESTGVLLKTDSLGNIVWEQSFKFGERSSTSEVIKTDGGYILNSSETSGGNGTPRVHHAFLTKVNASGEKVWEKKFQTQKGKINDILIATLPNGNLYCLLENYTSQPQKPTYIFTITPAGEIIAEKEIPDIGIAAMIQGKNDTMYFLQKEKIKYENARIIYAVRIKSLGADSLITRKRLPDGAKQSVFLWTDGHFYVTLLDQHKLNFFKITPDFQTTKEGTLDDLGNAAVDGFYMRNKNEALIIQTLEKPEETLPGERPTGKQDYHILLKKINPESYFNN